MIETMIELGDLLRGNQWSSVALAIVAIAAMSIGWAALERRWDRRDRRRSAKRRAEDDARSRDT